MNVYGIDRRTASLPFTLYISIKHILGPFFGIMGQKYGCRMLIIFGGILGTIDAAICFFVTNIGWYICIWGLLNGLAFSLTNILSQIILMQYFVKHKRVALEISYIGSCIGALVLPTIIEILLYRYGLNGTFLILAGLIMHSIPAAMLLKSPSRLPAIDEQNSLKSCQSNKTEVSEIFPTTNMFTKAPNIRKCERGIQVGNDKIQDSRKGKKVLWEMECKHITMPRSRSYSCHGLTYQMHLQRLQRSSMMPNMFSISEDHRGISSKTEPMVNVDMDYLKRNSELVYHMLSMEIPNVEISYRAILLEVEQDALWHPDKNEIMEEIEDIYCHIEKFLEIDTISLKSSEPDKTYLKRTMSNGAMTISKKSESVSAVKKYLKTYKERGLHQLGKIRSAPNMSNMYNEIARKDYVTSKLKQLYTGNEIRIISHLCQYNPKHVLKVLFQMRALYKMYSELESCDQCESNETSDSVETGHITITMHRTDSNLKEKVIATENSDEPVNSFKYYIKVTLSLYTNGIFLLICCTRVAFVVSFTILVTIIVDFARDKGLPEEDGKFIIGALSFGDVLGCISLGWVTDREYATLPRYMSLSMMILSVCIASFPFAHSRWTLLGALSLFGMLQGSLFIRHPCLVEKYLSFHEQSMAISCIDFASGICSLLLPVYIGYFRDTIGSYDAIFHMNGLLVMLTAIGWFFESRLVKTNHNTENQTAAP